VKILDWQGDLVRRVFTPEIQMRTGVVMIDVAIIYMAWWKFSGEPFGIYTMSVLALLFAGIVTVFEAKLAEEKEE
jgi:hypothetical protein